MVGSQCYKSILIRWGIDCMIQYGFCFIYYYLPRALIADHYFPLIDHCNFCQMWQMDCHELIETKTLKILWLNDTSAYFFLCNFLRSCSKTRWEKKTPLKLEFTLWSVTIELKKTEILKFLQYILSPPICSHTQIATRMVIFAWYLDVIFASSLIYSNNPDPNAGVK